MQQKLRREDAMTKSGLYLGDKEAPYLYLLYRACPAFLDTPELEMEKTVDFRNEPSN